jgi:hypothetical protein
MKRTAAFLTAVAVSILYLAAPAFAAPLPVGKCGKWDDVLKEHYKATGELPETGGVVQGGVLTLTLNPDTKTFSIFVQPSPEVMCAMAYGMHWTKYPDSVRLFPQGKPA